MFVCLFFFFVRSLVCLFLSSSLTRDAEACARSSNGGGPKNWTTRADRKINCLGPDATGPIHRQRWVSVAL